MKKKFLKISIVLIMLIKQLEKNGYGNDLEVVMLDTFNNKTKSPYSFLGTVNNTAISLALSGT